MHMLNYSTTQNASSFNILCCWDTVSTKIETKAKWFCLNIIIIFPDLRTPKTPSLWASKWPQVPLKKNVSASSIHKCWFHFLPDHRKFDEVTIWHPLYIPESDRRLPKTTQIQEVYKSILNILSPGFKTPFLLTVFLRLRAYAVNK